MRLQCGYSYSNVDTEDLGNLARSILVHVQNFMWKILRMYEIDAEILVATTLLKSYPMCACTAGVKLSRVDGLCNPWPRYRL